MSAADLEVAFGYTMGDITAMTRLACRMDRSLAGDVHTRYDTAWSAIVEHLYAADTRPDRRALVESGWQGIYADVKQRGQMFGQRHQSGAGYFSAPKFAQFWTVRSPAPEERIDDRIAVHQILPTLTDGERAAVLALALHDDYDRAAAALGLTYSALTGQLTRARRRFRAAWYAPDSPPPRNGNDRRVMPPLAPCCPHGHEFTPENTGRDSKGVRKCRACMHARAVIRSAAKKAARHAAKEMAA